MQTEKGFYRNNGYHVDSSIAEEFADKYVGTDGNVINENDPDFKDSLNKLLQGLVRVDGAFSLPQENQKLSHQHCVISTTEVF